MNLFLFSNSRIFVVMCNALYTLLFLFYAVATKMRTYAEFDARESFCHLVELLRRKLSEKQSRNELDIKSFYMYLSNCFPSKSLPNAVDVLIIFQYINAQELWDYRQYETVERIGLQYLPGDRELASAIEKHREMINNYLATQRIADYIEAGKETEGYNFELRSLKPSYHGRRTSKNYYDQLAVTLDISIRSKTLKYIRDLWKRIKRQFHLPDCNALFDHIYEGHHFTPASKVYIGTHINIAVIHYPDTECIMHTRNELASLAHSFYTCLKHQLMHQLYSSVLLG